MVYDFNYIKKKDEKKSFQTPSPTLKESVLHLPAPRNLNPKTPGNHVILYYLLLGLC